MAKKIRTKPEADTSKPEALHTVTEARAKGKGKAAAVSDELRQAVKDLGGDEDDLELIAGIDEDDGPDIAGPSTSTAEASSKSNEVRTRPCVSCSLLMG